MSYNLGLSESLAWKTLLAWFCFRKFLSYFILILLYSQDGKYMPIGEKLMAIAMNEFSFFFEILPDLVLLSFLRFCQTWTKRHLITSQTRVKHLSLTNHRPILEWVSHAGFNYTVFLSSILFSLSHQHQTEIYTGKKIKGMSHMLKNGQLFALICHGDTLV